jgi:histidyl-tRNA synthetase
MRNGKGTSSVGFGSGLETCCRVHQAEKTLNAQRGHVVMVYVSTLGTCDATGVAGQGGDLMRLLTDNFIGSRSW